ncbi:Gliding motility regulatory protein [Enhygromyxa salina]|uniref:histidine kinase n=1 Tax=Enhygromyxa salina TaxID=215803 RepID=A0A2S9YG76_9BACT|nr:response regulator [Enhygromyxa salina]PRQ04115.1 Gliding motility regulatory protein [Enhygromyxa salina]
MGRAGRREALLARFRSGSLTRITEVSAKLESPAPLSPELLSELRAPLHTLKGEARMLGLTSLAALVHHLEDRLVEDSAEEASLARVRAVIALIHARLRAPLLEDRGAERALERGLALLAGTDEQPELAEPGPGPGARVERADAPVTEQGPSSAAALGRAEADAHASFSMVRVDLVDELCERLEVLRVSLGSSSDRSASRDEEFRHELAELAELAWSLRLVPVEPALESLSEHARALGEELGKPLRVRIDAGGAQLERSLLERLQEPLMHLVHNAVDHGVEAAGDRAGKPGEAALEIVARSVGPEVEIAVIDDGRGVDLERVCRLARERGLLDEAAAAAAGPDELLPMLFESGLTTAATVSELSGRGVGLDAVRRAVEGLGGEVSISSERGRGARFTIRVPATISRETVVVVELGQTLWGLPSRRVGPVVAIDDDRTPSAASTVVVDGAHLPLLSLARLVGAGDSAEDSEDRVAICCSHAGRRYALASPTLLGEFELFRRPMGPLLASVGPASASSVMDDGRLVLLLEPAALLARRARQDTRELRPKLVKARPRVLVVDDSPIVRELIVELLTAAKLEVYTAGDGREALELLDRREVDLVLSDVEMPKVDGFELLARLRRRYPELPVIMVTTRGSVADRERASSLGADAYLVKSEFRDQNMLEAVARFVEVTR